MANLKPAEQPAEPEAFRYRRLPPPWQVVVTLFTTLAVFLAVNQLFNLQFFVGQVILNNGYLYLLLGLLLSLVFLLFPAARSAPFDRVPWRSEERRAGQEGVSTCSSRWSRSP